MHGDKEKYISTKCYKCNCFISIDELADHIDYHNALNELSLKELPKNVDELIKRRKLLIRAANFSNFTSTDDFATKSVIKWENRVNKINDAFELIKTYVENTFEITHQLKQEIKYDYQGWNLKIIISKCFKTKIHLILFKFLLFKLILCY